ncbi:hypothetical protein ANCCAN_01231 [Ancylostoma caninum]|uniref:Uncharacterized protein n=1 Tax=Ancylostoma caninum TaxID=29170 RepID=A0A368H7E1_ANCCA|nr:hypothetical protein ANCCAN_01231 [Ancylostoma caninum]
MIEGFLIRLLEFQVGYVFQRDNLDESGYFGPVPGMNYLSLYTARSSSDTGSMRPFIQIRPVYFNGTLGAPESVIVAATTAKTNNCTYPYYVPVNCTDDIYAYQLQIHTFSTSSTDPHSPSRQQQITAVCGLSGKKYYIEYEVPPTTISSTDTPSTVITSTTTLSTTTRGPPQPGSKRGMAFIVDSYGLDDTAFNSSIDAIVKFVNLYDMSNLQILLIENKNEIFKRPTFHSYTNTTFLSAISSIFARRTNSKDLQLDSVFSTILESSKDLNTPYNYIFYVTQTGGKVDQSLLKKLRESSCLFEISCIGVTAYNKKLNETVLNELEKIAPNKTAEADDWYKAMKEMVKVTNTTDNPLPDEPARPACLGVQASIFIAVDLSKGVNEYRQQAKGPDDTAIFILVLFRSKMQSIIRLFPTAFNLAYDISVTKKGCSEEDKQKALVTYKGSLVFLLNLAEITISITCALWKLRSFSVSIEVTDQGYSRISGWSFFEDTRGVNDPTFCVSNLASVMSSVGNDGGDEEPVYDESRRKKLVVSSTMTITTPDHTKKVFQNSKFHFQPS